MLHLNLYCIFIQEPKLQSVLNNKYVIQWPTSLVCSPHKKLKRGIIQHNDQMNITYSVNIDGINYIIYLCPLNNIGNIIDLGNYPNF